MTVTSSTTQPPDPLLGTLFGGRWIVQRPLMTGGMGSVYVAKHSDTGRPVALKVIKGAHAEDPAFVGRFRRETDALAAVSHPNVVGFLDSGVENGNLYLVMELLQGRALRDVMHAPVEWRRAFRIGADVCRALAAVHKLGIVHRDLKPENVFLQDSEGHDEFAKLIDFGIARLHDPPQRPDVEPSSHVATQAGVLVGTPGYISPEQLRGLPATPASDVYAVGVILYELVAGKPPFGAPGRSGASTTNIQEMLVRQLVDPVVPPRAHQPSLPANVDDAILRLMERDPEQRVQTAKDAIALLTSTLGDPSTGLASLPPSAATEHALGPTGTLLAVAPRSSAPAVASTTTPATTPTPPPAAGAAVATAAATAPVTSAPAVVVRRRWPRRVAALLALTLAIVVVAWVSAEGLRVPRDGDDVAAFWRRTFGSAAASVGRVVHASASAGARAAEREVRGPPREIPKGPRPTPSAVEGFVRGFATELAQCGGDPRPRTVRVLVHPSGRMDAVTSPDDAAARCLVERAKGWRIAPFDGAGVMVDVENVALGRR